MLNKLKFISPPPIKITIYNALVLSMIKYGTLARGYE